MHGNLDFALTLFEHLKLNSALTVTTYNQLINMHLQHDMLEAAYALIDSMYQSEEAIAPTSDSYLGLTIHLASQERFNEAMFLIREIRDHRVKLDLNFYNRIFDFLLEDLRSKIEPTDEGAQPEKTNRDNYIKAIRSRIMNGNKVSSPVNLYSHPNGYRFALTRFLLDLMQEMTTVSRLTPDWLSFQILLKISKKLEVLELQQNIIRAARKSSLPKAFVEEMWGFVKGEEVE